MRSHLAAPDTRATRARRLQRRLKEAGATVPLAKILDWTRPQIIDAFLWAEAQIDAQAKDLFGTSRSVLWPPHVSAANTKTLRMADARPKAPTSAGAVDPRAPDPGTRTTREKSSLFGDVS